MKYYKTPKGNRILVAETNWFTFGYQGHYNWFWISVKTLANEQILHHELIHHDQRVKEGFRFWRMLFDMDYLVDKEIEAYTKANKFMTKEEICHKISEYRVFPWASIFGFRTRPYYFDEVYRAIKDKNFEI